MSDKFILQYSGIRFGKTEQAAIDLAERARKYTSIEIVVTPHEDLKELRTQLQAANKRIERLKTHLSKFGDAWVDYQNEELEKETT